MKPSDKAPITTSIIIGVVVLVILSLLLFTQLNIQRYQPEISCPVKPPAQPAQEGNVGLPASIVTYSPKKFDLQSIPGLTQKQLNEHTTLYEGYVAKRNEIAQKLQTADRSNQNRTYSGYRALKLAETYAVNGSILHELYFENMTNAQTSPGTAMLDLIIKSFGSLENFKEDFFAAGLCSRGWVLTAYSFDDHRLHNFVLEEHNQTVPVLIIPLLVLDVYEHAYMIDFGIKRAQYLDVFWKDIDWRVVEKRIEKWVNKLKD